MSLHQDWQQSAIGAHLLHDHWTPDDALRILAGFDIATHPTNDLLPDWTDTLSPIVFQGHACQAEADAADALLDRMQDDLVRLRMIWKNTHREAEADAYPPRFYIEWALSKSFTPDWLDWAIGTGRYIPRDEAEAQSGRSLAREQYKEGGQTQEKADSVAPSPFDAPLPIASTEAPIPQYLLATPAQLIRAFGPLTGMDKSWFKSLGDKPGLRAARHTPGVAGRRGSEPEFQVFEVMKWLIDPKRRCGRKASENYGWRMLEVHFKRAYQHYEHLKPDTQ